MVRSRRNNTAAAKVKPKAKFYVIMGAITAVVVLAVFLFSKVNTATLEMGELRFEQEFPVIIIRDEQLISAENHGKANFIAQEGARVEADMPVAEVYKWGYNEKISYGLLDKQTTIGDYQENALMHDVQDPNLIALNQAIDDQAKNVGEVIKTGIGDLLAEERELTSLLTQKREYLNDTVPRDRKLEEFFDEERQLKERVDSYLEVKTAPQAGVVSYFFDGMEETLNANKLQEITYADIEEILNGNTDTASQPHRDDNGMTPLYRLVNNYKWYLLIETDHPMKELANQNSMQVMFDSFQGKQYEGTVVGYIGEDAKFIYVIEILDDIGELLTVRRADARVFMKFEGLKAPQEALKEKDGDVGVYVVDGKERDFVPVKVEIIKDGNAIISPLDDSMILTSGQKVEV